MSKPATLDAALGARYRKLVARLVKSGRYDSEEKVVRAAMKLLEEDEKFVAEEIEAIRRGMEDVRAGRTRPAADVFADLERKFPDVRRRRARRGA